MSKSRKPLWIEQAGGQVTRPARLIWNQWDTSRKVFVRFINVDARLRRERDGKITRPKGVMSLGFMVREDGSLGIGMAEKLDRKRAGFSQFTEMAMELTPMEVRALLSKLYQAQVQFIFEDFNDAIKGTPADVINLEGAM